MKKYKIIFSILILISMFLSPIAIAEEAAPPESPPPTEAPPTTSSPPPTEAPTTTNQPQQPTETTTTLQSGGEPTQTTQPPSQPPQSRCPPERSCMQGEECVPCPGQGQNPPQNYQPQPGTCPQGMCQDNGGCFPCNQQPSGQQGQPGQYQQRPGEQGCPPKPPIPCSPDQRAEPNLDERGCVKNWKCMGQGTAGGGQVNIPQGCKRVENEYSVQIVCEQDQQFSDIKAGKEKSCVQSGGKFYIREDGSFECSYEGTQGFFQPVQCPNFEQSKKIEQECRNKGCQEEYYLDKNGCHSINCREKFQEFKSEEEKLKYQSISCQENGGQFITNEQGVQCVGGTQNIRISTELKPLDGIELLKIALEMENVMQTFNQIADKLEALKNYYEQRGDDKKANSFSIALSQLDGALTRLDEIRIGLAENADNLQEQDRINALEDIQQMNSIIKDIAITLLTGGKSRRQSTTTRTTPQKPALAPQQGIDPQEAFKKCADFSSDNPYTFEPEPGTKVQLKGLDNGRCIMAVTPPGLGQEVTFKLPAEVYQFFNS